MNESPSLAAQMLKKSRDFYKLELDLIMKTIEIEASKGKTSALIDRECLQEGTGIIIGVLRENGFSAEYNSKSRKLHIYWGVKINERVL